MATNEDTKGVSERKVAPKIVIRSSPKRGSIDELIQDNAGQDFVYAPAGTSEASLAESGLEAVTRNGEAMTVKDKMICRVVGKQHSAETKESFDAAHRMISEIREKGSQITDKSSVKKDAASTIKDGAEIK